MYATDFTFGSSIYKSYYFTLAIFALTNLILYGDTNVEIIN